jgi:hypothetical protein
MDLGVYTFAADFEGDGSSSWVEVLCFWDEQISCSNLGLSETKV